MKEKLKTITQLNWIKTLYINFKMLPFADAIKLPIFVFSGCKMDLRSGVITFNTPIKRSTLKIGYRYETFNYNEPVQFIVNGELEVNGTVWIGTGVHLSIAQGAKLSMGEMSSIGSCSSLTCCQSITFSDYARIGSFSEITDCNYHYMKDTTNGAIYPMNRPIFLGSKNYIGSRVAILPGTITPNNTTIAYGTVCNKDYRKIIPENSVIAGVPAKLVKENIVRIFDFEKEDQITQYFKETGKEVYYDTDED